MNGAEAVTHSPAAPKKEVPKSAQSRLGKSSTPDTMRLMSRVPVSTHKRPAFLVSSLESFARRPKPRRREVSFPAKISTDVAGGRASSRAGQDGGCGGGMVSASCPVFWSSSLSGFSGPLASSSNPRKLNDHSSTPRFRNFHKAKLILRRFRVFHPSPSLPPLQKLAKPLLWPPHIASPPEAPRFIISKKLNLYWSKNFRSLRPIRANDAQSETFQFQNVPHSAGFLASPLHAAFPSAPSPPQAPSFKISKKPFLYPPPRLAFRPPRRICFPPFFNE